MKRTIAALLAVVICITLSACGKGQAVKDVENAIKAIGEVTLDSGEAIEKAERLYDFLTESEKSDVANKGNLIEARNTYDELYSEKLYNTAKEAYELINKAYSMYVYDGRGLRDAMSFATKANAYTMDDDFCKRLANATPDYMGLPQLTEQEIAEGMQYCYDMNYFEGNERATQAVCMIIFQNTFTYIRKYAPWDELENAGVLLLELKDTYHDEKYYPILKEYFDFVMTGYTFHTDTSNLSSRITDYESQKALYMQQIDPMFVN